VAVLYISTPTFTFFYKLRAEVRDDLEVAIVCPQLEDGTTSTCWSLFDCDVPALNKGS
jgi:hypothetical protein